jgi:thiosulfate dehydrogenase [quinone] large subunit
VALRSRDEGEEVNPDLESAHPERSAAPGRQRSTSAARERTAVESVVLGLLRLAMGWTFLWPFLDKTFGLGHETASADAWIDGGSPTAGFLGNATAGPLAGMYQDLAGQAWADWLFMLGLLGIGVALLAGVATRIAAASGALLLVLMWSAVLPPANNPFLDDHLVYALLLAVLALTHAGRYIGLGRWWEGLPLVRRVPVLR